ncbi:hypothetical protein AMELA_G00081640 [Ameiurus melas]|uniref:Ig-like domain-containing protein n=1 Tax=Ameiurus melas TaxID=219545 RepID=A0A7J6B0L3_AMEME|nr:hypothetical protein AMELA_G00081640 [Ameiurus melas]
MEQAVVVILVITLLTVSGQEGNLLPPGPINKEVGANVLLTTIPSSEQISIIRWHFNGTEVIKYVRPGTITVNPNYNGRVNLNYTTGDLELKNLTMADSGKYTLTFTFESGLGNQDHILLQVFEPVVSFDITGPEGNLIENSTGTFTCKGNGTISSTVWLKKDEILANSNSITFLDDNRTMVINPLLRSDSGDYQCVISNPVSSSTATYSITVNYGPDVRILGAQTFEEGSAILLLCVDDSFPAATITWTVQGMPAKNASLYVTENSKLSDSGEYKCTCWNSVTGIRASAVQSVTVRAVSSRLGPGVEAGITVGVIFAVVILVVLIYFLVKHFKKPTDTVRETPVPMIVNQQTTVPTVDKLKGSRPNVYQNSQPSPPLRKPPTLPRPRDTNDSDIYCNSIN